MKSPNSHNRFPIAKPWQFSGSHENADHGSADHGTRITISIQNHMP